METLHLNLKKQWYDMIGSGEKKEEYRDISDYWARRLVHVDHEIESAAWVEFIEDLRDPNRRHKDWKECMAFFGAHFHKFTQVHFKNGYSRAGSRVAPEFYIQLSEIRVGCGREDWGAEPGKEYFILVLGDILPKVAEIKCSSPDCMGKFSHGDLIEDVDGVFLCPSCGAIIE